MSERENAVIVGVGPGLGWHLVEACAGAGMRVALAARRRERLEALLAASSFGDLLAAGCDVADAEAVEALFAEAESEQGPPDLVVFNASARALGGILELDPEQVEQAWKVGALGGLHVAQAALRRMAGRGKGTLIFTGATAGLRGSKGFGGFAMVKFSLRALAQSAAREFGPQGVHVVHVNIDGQIASARTEGRDPKEVLDPAAIAETYLMLHRQHPTAWTQELDLRPSVEKF
ncbi:NADP-dependent 3-hydroxy acid dehydrogenase YdfG [Tistlia consotensis]|uniref:NADP-dependent 3-hydroxy acid dehydrogenase YdfG n=1 Tax=Tistlia consotensis USBA 355 TaxID=560819 RepID=A0A1Y6CFS3_9PROT|nr:SDR family NAD(P)-dependent oxidoreductase [Tistlia consotensis]SMF53999.1 NADP-dependent 3-hydroxy acid dehydrogenase YdfG [Tistlia consotensis USBA 355]SNR86368.1 NADP-dependent 3-hydroxy acid dehydrogenase YdfG [Tistlia consotensis]